MVPLGSALVEHVRVGVDQAGQDRGLAEVNDLRPGGNLDLRFGTLRP